MKIAASVSFAVVLAFHPKSGKACSQGERLRCRYGFSADKRARCRNGEFVVKKMGQYEIAKCMKNECKSIDHADYFSPKYKGGRLQCRKGYSPYPPNATCQNGEFVARTNGTYEIAKCMKNECKSIDHADYFSPKYKGGRLQCRKGYSPYPPNATCQKVEGKYQFAARTNGEYEIAKCMKNECKSIDHADYSLPKYKGGRLQCRKGYSPHPPKATCQKVEGKYQFAARTNGKYEIAKCITNDCDKIAESRNIRRAEGDRLWCKGQEWRDTDPTAMCTRIDTQWKCEFDGQVVDVDTVGADCRIVAAEAFKYMRNGQEVYCSQGQIVPRP